METVARKTATERVRDLFLASPGRWIETAALRSIAGQDGWRTRVSEARLRYNMTIEPRSTYVKNADGTVRYKINAYRFVPPAPSGASLPLFDAPAPDSVAR